MQTCLKAEKTIVKFTSLSNQTSGSTITISLPQGMRITQINSVLLNGSGTSYSQFFLSQNRIGLLTLGSSLAIGDVIRIEFLQYANCSSGSTTFIAQDSFYFSGSSGNFSQIGNSFNGFAPSISISSISHTPSPVAGGSPTTKKFTVSNSGFGASSRILIVEKYTPGDFIFTGGSYRINPSGVNYTIPVSRITVKSDSLLILLNASDISNIGDGDTLFENSESFEIQYQITPQNCGISNSINSQLIAFWLCNSNSRCNGLSSNSTLSIGIPGTPNLTRLPIRSRRFDCFNNTQFRDTVRILNNGAGPATNIQILQYITIYPNMFNSTAMGFLDTSILRYSIGRNGVLLRPNYTVTGTINGNYSSWGCNLNGRVGRTRIVIPNLNAGDTLFFYTGSVQCQYNVPCNSNSGSGHDIVPPGISYDLSFQNGCGNINYNGGTQIVIEDYNYCRAYMANLAPPTAKTGESLDLVQKITDANPESGFDYPSRTRTEIEVSLPSVLVLDSSFAHPVYFETQGGTIVNPTTRPGNYRFAFRRLPYLGLGKLHIRVKGKCDTNFCPGLFNWTYQWKINPDTTSCSFTNTVICKNFSIAWLSNCKSNCCDLGLVNIEYSSNRINFGLPDNNNDKRPDISGSINKSLVRTEQFIPGDTIEFYYKGVYKTNSTHTQWEFSRIIFDASVSSRFDLISDSVFVNRFVGTDTAFRITPSITGGRYYSTDVSFMNDFLNNDTIVVKMKLRINANGNLDWSFNSMVNAWAAHIANPTNPGVDLFTCTPIQDFGIVWRRLNGIDNTPASTLTSTGCQTVIDQVYYYIETGFLGRGQADKFDFEYRPFAYPSQFRMFIPPGYSVDSVKLREWYHHTGGTATTNHPYFMQNRPFTQINDTLKFNLSNLYTPNGGLILPTDEGAYGYIWIYLRPSCRAANNVPIPLSAQQQYISFTSPSTTSFGFGTSFNTQGTIRNLQPQFVTSSSNSTVSSFEKKVSWPIQHTNATNIVANNVWFYFYNASGTFVVDSIKLGSVLILPDANGFFRLGNVGASAAISFTVFAKFNNCSTDSLLAYNGYSCSNYPSSFSPTLCSNIPIKLFVAPQVASIQTQISSLANTPNIPAVPSSGNYNRSVVNMCRSFPVEMTVQNSGAAMLYNVTENVILPINGLNVGVDYITDSGYIEYPIGTTPRAFSSTANSVILSQVSSGYISLNLNQIDPVNFNADKGLPGTGTSSSSSLRSAILRFKLRANCNLRSGTPFTVEQRANNACGANAIGSSNLLSGYALNLDGVTTVPYIAEVRMANTISGCNGDSCSFKVIKIGSSAVNTGDSIRLFIPNILQSSNFRCIGSNCPSAFPTFVNNAAIGGREFTIKIPSTMSNLDSLVFRSYLKTPANNNCGNNVRIGCDVTRQLVIFCPTLGSNCPNTSQSLGNSNRFIQVTKPNLTISTFAGSYLTGLPVQWKYRANGIVSNSGNTVANTDTTRINYYFDANNNNTLETNIDSFIYSRVYKMAIPNGGTNTFSDTFVYGKLAPSATRSMFAAIETKSGTGNCNCAAMTASTNIMGLELEKSYIQMKETGCSPLLQYYTGTRKKGTYVLYRTDKHNLVQAIDSGSMNENEMTLRDRPLVQGFYTYRLIHQDEQKTTRQIAILNTYIQCKNSEMSIVPNPNSGIFSISLLNQEINSYFEYEIFNSDGRKIISGKSFGAETQVDLSKHSKGVYTVWIRIDDKKWVEKIVLL